MQINSINNVLKNANTENSNFFVKVTKSRGRFQLSNTYDPKQAASPEKIADISLKILKKANSNNRPSKEELDNLIDNLSKYKDKYNASFFEKVVKKVKSIFRLKSNPVQKLKKEIEKLKNDAKPITLDKIFKYDDFTEYQEKNINKEIKNREQAVKLLITTSDTEVTWLDENPMFFHTTSIKNNKISDQKEFNPNFNFEVKNFDEAKKYLANSPDVNHITWYDSSRNLLHVTNKVYYQGIDAPAFQDYSHFEPSYIFWKEHMANHFKAKKF